MLSSPLSSLSPLLSSRAKSRGLPGFLRTADRLVQIQLLQLGGESVELRVQPKANDPPRRAPQLHQLLQRRDGAQSLFVGVANRSLQDRDSCLQVQHSAYNREKDAAGERYRRVRSHQGTHSKPRPEENLRGIRAPCYGSYEEHASQDERLAGAP
eukprot:scaffold7066_cov253-Pinguiococcus_pyrenoidosus.AAC.26